MTHEQMISKLGRLKNTWIWSGKYRKCEIMVPLVVGALGTPAKELKKRLKTIGIETKITELQKA